MTTRVQGGALPGVPKLRTRSLGWVLYEACKLSGGPNQSRRSRAPARD